MPDDDYLEHNHLDETYKLEDNDNEPSFVQEIITALKATDNQALSQLSAYVPTDEADDFIGSMLIARVRFFEAPTNRTISKHL